MAVPWKIYSRNAHTKFFLGGGSKIAELFKGGGGQLPHVNYKSLWDFDF